jgi:peroxiredoxin
MKKSKIVLFALLLVSLSSFRLFQSAEAGKEVNDFSLRSTNGKMVSLNDVKDAKGYIIIFTCNHCPFAKLYSQRMNDLEVKYRPLGIPLLAINSMDSVLYKDERFEGMCKKSRQEKFSFSYLQDADQSVGKNFGAEHTPHAYVIWKENGKWIIKYSGAIDDNGEHPELATPYIGNAVKELLQDKPVSVPETQSFGCQIYYRN